MSSRELVTATFGGAAAAWVQSDREASIARRSVGR